MRVVLALFFLFLSTGWALAFSGQSVRAGNDHYRREDYDGAIEKYEQSLKKNPESAMINFNLGTAYYKKEEWQKAAGYLQKSLLGDDPALQQKAHYNLGNVFYKSGAAQENINVDGAVEELEKSVGQFEQAVQLDAQDKDARANYDFVRRELQRLKKIQQEQKKGQKSSKPSQGQDQKQNKDKTGQGKPNDQDGKKDQPSQDQGQKPDAPPDQPPQPDGEGDQPDENQPGDDQPPPSGQQPAPGDNDKKDKPGSAPQAGSMTPDEAKSLLDDYQQNDEPKGLLNFLKKPGDDSPVNKDW